MTEDPRTEEEREAGLTYEQMMAKRRKEAVEGEKLDAKAKGLPQYLAEEETIRVTGKKKSN